MVLGEGENFFSREKKFSPSPNPNPFQEKRSTLLRPDFLSWLGFSMGSQFPPFSRKAEYFAASGFSVLAGIFPLGHNPPIFKKSGVLC
ncbi:MAG: hypothetical protein IKD29_06305, partial [Lentisphaeria bacterium]|nr:hypothetical protein [Lentisphaeria bacterium]